MRFELTTNVSVVNPSANLDDRYGPHMTLQDAYTHNPRSLRVAGKTFGLIENGKVVEYWWESDDAIEDGDEVKKNEGGIANIFIDYNDITELLTNQNDQNKNTIYVVADATADNRFTFPDSADAKIAYYRYNGSATANLENDYSVISAPFALSDDTQLALDGKEDSFNKGSLIAGTNISLSGALANRLVGSGDITVNANVSGMKYMGTWDASENEPTLSDSTGEEGNFYRVIEGGTVDLGSGNITFVAGDDVIHNGVSWERAPSSLGGPDVFENNITVALDPEETFGKYKNGDVIPSQGKTAAEVIIMSVQKALAPTVSLSSPTSIEFNETEIENELNFSYTINSLGASVASVKLEWRRGGVGSWTELELTDAENATSYTHIYTDSEFNTLTFNYRYTVTDTQGASKSATVNITPASYQAPTLTDFSVGNQTRDRGDIETNITGTITRRSDLVKIEGYRVQYRVNGGSWVNLTNEDSPLLEGGGSVNESHNDISFVDSDKIEYRVEVIDEHKSTFIGGIKTINFRHRNFLGYSTKESLNLNEILSLANSTLSDSRSRTVNNVTAPANNYTYYAYRADAGDLTSIIQDGAAPVLGAFTKLADVSGTNSFGASVSYRIYKSNATQAFSNNNLNFS